MKHTNTRGYFDGFCRVRTVLMDRASLQEILGSLEVDPDSDAAVTPWRRRPHAALQAALER